MKKLKSHMEAATKFVLNSTQVIILSMFNILLYQYTKSSSRLDNLMS